MLLCIYIDTDGTTISTVRMEVCIGNTSTVLIHRMKYKDEDDSPMHR